LGKRYKEELIIIKINNWTECFQDRVMWKKVVQKTKISNSEDVVPVEEDVYIKRLRKLAGLS